MSQKALVITTALDYSLKLWDYRSLKNPSMTKISHQTFSAHSGAINKCCFSNDGSRLVTASCDNSIMIWKFSGDKIGEMQKAIQKTAWTNKKERL